MKNISYYIAILLCALNKPFIQTLLCLTPSRCHFPQTSHGSQVLSNVFLQIEMCLWIHKLPLAYKGVVSPGMMTASIHLTLCLPLSYPVPELQFSIQTGTLHFCRADSSISIDSVCKVVLPSKS